MVQCIKVFAARPDDLSLITKTHMVKRENKPHQLFSELHMFVHMRPRAHTHIQSKYEKKK